MFLSVSLHPFDRRAIPTCILLSKAKVRHTESPLPACKPGCLWLSAFCASAFAESKLSLLFAIPELPWRLWSGEVSQRVDRCALPLLGAECTVRLCKIDGISIL
jgi:hypothetical protein